MLSDHEVNEGIEGICELVDKYNALIEQLIGYIGDDGSTLQTFLTKQGNDDIDVGADYGAGTIAFVTFNADNVQIWGINGANVAVVQVDENGIVLDVTDGADTCTIEHLPTGLYINNNGDVFHVGEVALTVPDTYRIGTDAGVSRVEFYDDEIRIRISDGVVTRNNSFDETGIHTDGIIESTNTDPLKDRTPDECIRNEQINIDNGLVSIELDPGANITLTPSALTNHVTLNLTAGDPTPSDEFDINIDYDDVLGITGVAIQMLIENNSGAPVEITFALTNADDLGVIRSKSNNDATWNDGTKVLIIDEGLYQLVILRASNIPTPPDDFAGVVTIAHWKLDT